MTIRLWPVMVLGMILISTAAAEAQPAGEEDSRSIALRLANMLNAADKVISDSQALINDPDKGDKGITADAVLAKAAANYAELTKSPWPSQDGNSRQARITSALTSSIRSVMNDAQPQINEPGKGFKFFFPPIFTDRVAREFNRSMANVAVIRYTTLQDLLRNRRHRPDEWEAQIMDKQFRSPSWRKGTEFAERIDYKDKPSVRLMIAQYYDQSCLECHGEPKGERDKNGGYKEGAKLGDFGGAISVVVFDAN